MFRSFLKIGAKKTVISVWRCMLLQQIVNGETLRYIESNKIPSKVMCTTSRDYTICNPVFVTDK
jgi:hypothetical protein